MGQRTHLYLLDYRRYSEEIVPTLDHLLDGTDLPRARTAFEESVTSLTKASADRQHPWTPFHRPYRDRFDEGRAILNGQIPEVYHGDRVSLGLLEPDEVTTDPNLVREYYLRDCVCGMIVEGLCVPWKLDFPPVHVVIGDLYEYSKRFEELLCGEIYERSGKVPYDIHHCDDLADADLIAELTSEIARIVPPGSELWQIERHRNLYRLLHYGLANNGFRILASYF